MATVRGFELPEDLYYMVEKHVWVRPLGEGLAQVGLTPVAYHLLQHSLVAISVRPAILGRRVAAGRSVAMVESLKYNGPVPAPFAGSVARINQRVADDPTLAETDPYGDGWIVEMRAEDPSTALNALLTGKTALSTYEARLVSENVSLA